jgi:hypothetical protein
MAGKKDNRDVTALGCDALLHSHASNRSVTANTYCICANDSGNLSTGLYVVSRRDENEEIVVNSGHPHCAFSLWRHIDELPAAEFTAKKAAKR